MSERKVPVIYQGRRKLVNVDFGSFETVVSPINRRFKITGFQLFWQRSDNEAESFVIEDDDDLEELEDVEGLVLLVKDLSLSSKAKITVIYGEKTKKIEVERSNFKTIQTRVKDRFKLTGDFQLQVKDDSGTMINIDSDEDATENLELMHTVWVTIPVKLVVTNDMHSVILHGREYFITETPDFKSVIVTNAIAALENSICIPSISAKLNEVEGCLRIAYYASTDHKELNKKTQEMQFDIQKLCLKCDTTMLKIKLKAADLLNELQCGFAYFMDGFENYGLERLEAVGPIAKEIQKEAATLEGAVTLRMGADEKKEEVDQLQHKIGNLAEKEKSHLQAASQYRKSTSGIGFGFKKLITFGFYEGNKPLAEQEERLAREMREEEARDRERLAKLKEEEMKAMKEFNVLMERMVDRPKEMSEDAVQGANGALRGLQSVLNEFSEFWKSTLAQFEHINNKGMIDQLKKLSDPKSRKNFWKSPAFKGEVMKYVANFVAIQSMCDEFHKAMAKVLNDIHQCIRDNPTAAEAKAKLPKLVEQFKKQKEQQGAGSQQEYAEAKDPDIEDLS